MQAYVHIVGQFTQKGQCIIDDNDNLLILHPDQLISATVVADSFGCMRRAVLQDRVKATSEPSAPLIYGTMLHEIFQDALLANTWDRFELTKIIDRITAKHVEDLYTIKVGIPAAKEHLQSKMAELSHWAQAFVSATPKVRSCCAKFRSPQLTSIGRRNCGGPPWKDCQHGRNKAPRR